MHKHITVYLVCRLGKDSNVALGIFKTEQHAERYARKLKTETAFGRVDVQSRKVDSRLVEELVWPLTTDAGLQEEMDIQRKIAQAQREEIKCKMASRKSNDH